MKYRPEIDGLRAIAVLSVIFYHMGIIISGKHLFTGGFLGVDVFFVISGYLITGILLKQLAEGNYTFRNFYERRARRILPMLFTVMAVSVPLAWHYMFPAPFISYAKSILSSVFFSSNLVFQSEGGYAAGPNALKPFLHTWSLSIEEQFYLFFPVLLLVCWKYARQFLMPLLVIGFASSLGLAEWSSHKHATADFYLLPTRAWELIAGAFLAKLESSGRFPKHNFFTNCLPALGIVIMIASILAFDDAVPHPSLWTLIPVAGAMLVIYFGHGKDIGARFLSLKPVVAIGLISYSLYLWHQPLFAFARLASVNELSGLDKTELLFLTFVLSYFSWKFIEKPFRDKTTVPFKTLYVTLLIAAVAISGFAIAGLLTNGFTSRFNFPIISELDKQQKDLLITKDGTSCHERDVGEACTLGDKDSSNRWIIVGDSHMGYLSTLLWNELKDKKASLTILTKGGCPYAPGLVVGKGEDDHPCNPKVNEVRRAYLLKAKPSTIVLGGRLPYYLSGEYFDNQEGGVELQQGNFTYKLNPPDKVPASQSKEYVQKTLEDDIQELLNAGHKVVLVYPVPEAGWNPAETLKKILLSKSDKDFAEWMKSGGVTTSYKVFKERAVDAYKVYDALGKHPGLYRVYPEKFFCDRAIKARCITHDDKNIFYADQDHLSQLGNRMIAREITKDARK